jgi:dihydrofolate reductase
MKAIVAADNNGVIGSCGKIPWHSKEDFEWFKKETRYCNLIMGKKTYESLPFPFLVNRNIYVVTTSVKPSAIFGAHDCQVHFCRVNRVKILFSDLYFNLSAFVVGGQRIYEEFVPQCSELLLTRVTENAEHGDAFFPDSLLDTFDKREAVRDIDIGRIYRYTNTDLTVSQGSC